MALAQTASVDSPFIVDNFTEVKKCMGDYLATVKARQYSTSVQPYMPRCSSDGSYHPTQCHPTIGYCWCVNIHSGKPIQGTTTKTNSLDCWQYGE